MLTKDVLKIDSEKTTKEIVNFIRKKVKDLNRNGVIFGLSGGLDSVVLAYLLVKAVNKDKILALLMPERDSNKEHVKDAIVIAKSLGIKYQIIDMKPILDGIGIYRTLPGKYLTSNLKVKALYKTFQAIVGKNPFTYSTKGIKNKYVAQGNAFYRIKHRLRMTLLYYYGESLNYLMVGAANKTEHLTGFYVKQGIDHVTDIMPIQGLYKTQVRQLAKYLGVPEKIIKKAPSPDIIPGVVDEQAMGMTYDLLDLILYSIEKKMNGKEIAKQLKIKESEVNIVKEMFRDSQHMRDPAYEP